MRFITMMVLTAGVLLSLFSCATSPTRSLSPGELRLLKIDVPLEANTRRGLPFLVNIHFEADGKPEMKRAGFYFSEEGPYCFKIINVKYGPPRTMDVEIRTNLYGSYSLVGFVQYLRDGKTELTNKVSTLIHIIP